MRLRSMLLLGALIASIAPAATAAPVASPTAQDRSVDPVLLTGASFPSWSAGPDPTFREPEYPHNYDTADVEESVPEELQSECYEPEKNPNPYDPEDNGDHNCYQSSRLPHNPREGVDVHRLLGYRWNAASSSFEQIPFQVDERFTRYITNNGSGFAFYSGTDQETTFAWDREGFRYSSDESQYVPGGNVCLAAPAKGSTIGEKGFATTPDPVKGLDDDDELVFMWSDASAQAPVGTPLPAGIDSAYEIPVVDPSNPGATVFAYVMLAKPDGPAAAFDASNGYVHYMRDANADIHLYSQSSYGDYGAAPKGPYCTPEGARDTSHGAIAQRRPGDGAWIKTDRYAFRYDGRWLMTELHVSNATNGLAGDGFENYGPDIIDQWKARAFQQRPGGQTPCCGYEEEVNNWGGSSILMGERWGPVRAIRAAWGADSSTNNVKTEIFYAKQIRFDDNLRVHVIPPFDGIYVQWDYNAGAVDTYFNPFRPEGVPIDGKNDEVVGNSNMHIAGDRIEIQDGDQHVTVPLAGGDPESCDLGDEDGVCNDVDSPDPTHSGPEGALIWEEIAGNNGTLVTRWQTRQHTAGDAYSVFSVPYYRDDSCFDDGTGTNPGPHLHKRGVDDGTWGKWNGIDRVCWKPGDILTGVAELDAKYWQGDIATHGLHLEFIADSDNAAMTVPITEVDSEQRMVVLPSTHENVGEVYGRSIEFPLQASARPFA
jgi:hypothetical protein